MYEWYFWAIWDCKFCEEKQWIMWESVNASNRFTTKSYFFQQFFPSFILSNYKKKSPRFLTFCSENWLPSPSCAKSLICPNNRRRRAEEQPAIKSEKLFQYATLRENIFSNPLVFKNLFLKAPWIERIFYSPQFCSIFQSSCPNNRREEQQAIKSEKLFTPSYR